MAPSRAMYPGSGPDQGHWTLVGLAGAAVVVVATVVGAGSLAGCYQPTPADCQLACTAATGCPGELTCGADGFCHGAGDAPSCAVDAAVDAAAPPVSAIAAGAHHACAILDGHLWCWGDNRAGQLGRPTATRRAAVPAEVDAAAAPWTAVATGRNHTCGVHGGGVWCWGDASSSQIGGDVSSSLAVEVMAASGPLTGATAVCAGDRHTCAIVDGGAALVCWGDDSAGQRGDGPGQLARATAAPVVEPAGAGPWTALACGASHTCGLRGGAAYCWGANDHGQLGRTSGATDRPAVALTGLTAPSAIMAGDQLGCALDGGALRCWGAVGGATRTTPADFTPPTLLPRGVTVATAGGAGVCASSGAQTYCTGTDGAGERGDGRFDYVAGYASAVVAAPAVTALTSGAGFHCAIADGAVRCWGDNSSGQIGAGVVATGFTPRQVPGAWRAVVAGRDDTCALTTAGQVQCWGRNRAGLVPGAPPSVDVPTVVPGVPVADRIAVATDHACAREAGSGRIWCWGDGEYGRVGNGVTSPAANQPAAVRRLGVDLLGATSLAVSDHATMAADPGHLYGWGDNADFRIAAAAAQAYGAAQEVDIDVWGQLALGQTFGCGVRGPVPGQAACWGDDSAGQQGNGAATGVVMRPTAIAGALELDTLAAGVNGAHVCGLAGGALYCWGDNRQYQAAQPGNGLVLAPARVGVDVGWTAVAAGASGTCGIRAGGLYCWGRDDRDTEQCGLDRDSGNAFVPTPTQVGLDLGAVTFTAVAVGDRHGCAIASDDRLFCWGDSRQGATGLAGATFHPVARAVRFP